MPRNITLTLGAGLGSDLGPNFTLTANVGSVTPSTATKSELLVGKTVSVDNAATQVTITSTGTCTNAISQTIPCGPTTTTTTTTAAPTTTTTTTAAPTTTTTTTTAAPTTTTTTTAAPTIYTHGAVRGSCTDYCTTNYLIQTVTNADGDYYSLTIGDTIYGQGGYAGWVAYSNVSTDTNTGPFKIAQIDTFGEVLGISVCSGASCVPL